MTLASGKCPGGTGEGTTLDMAVLGIWNHSPTPKLETHAGRFSSGGGGGDWGGDGQGEACSGDANGELSADSSPPPPQPPNAKTSSDACNTFLTTLAEIIIEADRSAPAGHA